MGQTAIHGPLSRRGSFNQPPHIWNLQWGLVFCRNRPDPVICRLDSLSSTLRGLLFSFPVSFDTDAMVDKNIPLSVLCKDDNVFRNYKSSYCERCLVLTLSWVCAAGGSASCSSVEIANMFFFHYVPFDQSVKVIKFNSIRWEVQSSPPLASCFIKSRVSLCMHVSQWVRMPTLRDLCWCLFFFFF